MFTTLEKPSDYRLFLLGIIFYSLFEFVWWGVSPVFFALQGLLSPIPVIVGKELLRLAWFYFIFRKATVWDLRWKHLAIVVALYVVVQFLFGLATYTGLSDHFFTKHFDISNLTLRKVSMWSWVISDLVIMSFLWWNFDTLGESGQEADDLAATNRHLCGSMLFFNTFELALFSVNHVANSYGPYTYHPALLDCLFYPLLLAITAGTIYLIIRKKMIVPPLAILLALFALFVFTKCYFPNIVFDHYSKLEPSGYYNYVHFFTNVSGVCIFAVFLTAFYLFRKGESDTPGL